MDDEQSLLEQVRQKEGELKTNFEIIRVLNERKILEAKNQAADNIAAAERESEEETRRYCALQRLGMQKEMDGLKQLNDARKTEISARGEENLQKAVSRIVNLVSMKDDYAAENG